MVLNTHSLSSAGKQAEAAGLERIAALAAKHWEVKGMWSTHPVASAFVENSHWALSEHVPFFFYVTLVQENRKLQATTRFLC
jgi:hypothetical protein